MLNITRHSLAFNFYLYSAGMRARMLQCLKKATAQLKIITKKTQDLSLSLQKCSLSTQCSISTGSLQGARDRFVEKLASKAPLGLRHTIAQECRILATTTDQAEFSTPALALRAWAGVINPLQSKNRARPIAARLKNLGKSEFWGNENVR